MSINTDLTDEQNHTSVKGYLLVFGALMCLTLLTVIMSRIHFGLLANAVIAVLIAAAKASLVIYFFMHVRESPRIIGFIVVGSVAWLAILFLFTVPDFISMYGEGSTSIPHAKPW